MLILAAIPLLLAQPAAAWEQGLKSDAATTLVCDAKDANFLKCVKKTRDHRFLTHLIGGPEHEVLVFRVDRDVWEHYPSPPGGDGKLNIAAWKFHLGEAFDFSAQPLYTINYRGIDVDLHDFLVVRHLGRSAYFDLTSGEHAFDSTTNLTVFAFNPAQYDWRFGTFQAFARAGYPGHPGAVGVVTYGMEGKVLQQALVDVDGDKALRKFFFGKQAVTTEVAWVHADGSPVSAQQMEADTSKVRLELRFSTKDALLGPKGQSISLRLPVSETGLVPSQAELPKGARLSAWPVL